MPAYDSTAFHPPAPIALVTIRSPNNGSVVADVPLLLDSGADVSLLPRQAIAPLLDFGQELPAYELEGFDGTKSTAPAIYLELIFLGKTFRGQFLVVDDDCGILGRNVLNSVSLLLNGPALTWGEHR